MSLREKIFSIPAIDGQMYASVTVSQNEPIVNTVLNRGLGQLNYNDEQLNQLNKLVFSQLNISEYIPGCRYNVGDLVWYKDSRQQTYLLRCIRQDNDQEPDTREIENGAFSKHGNDALLLSGWENQNKNLSIFDYDVMSLVAENAQNAVVAHQDDQTMHPFGSLEQGLDTKILKSDLTNIDINRKHVFFPQTVERIGSNAVTVTGYSRNFGSIVEYDIILKLASSHSSSFRDLFQDAQPLSANNTSFTLFAGISQSSIQFQKNSSYFTNPADMDIFQPDSTGESRIGIVTQRGRNDYVNTYTAKVKFPHPFSNINYMVFSNSILSQTVGSRTMVPSANDIAYCDKTRQSITFINITFPDSRKYSSTGYNARNGGLTANSFHMKVIGQLDWSSN